MIWTDLYGFRHFSIIRLLTRLNFRWSDKMLIAHQFIF